MSISNQSESRLQSECFQWAWNHKPETRRLIFHVPNGGKRGLREAAELKAVGVMPGIPDLLFLWRGKLYPFELKTDIGVLSAAQKELHHVWLYHGTEVKIIRTLADFQTAIISIIQTSQ